MKKIPLSVILVVHNEEDTIENEIKEYYGAVKKKLPGSELIIAEDGSTDNTRDIIYNVAEKLPIVLLLTPKKRGYAASLQLALRKAKGETILYADAGNKHDPKDIWKLYAKIMHNDVVTGYKKKRHDPYYRLILAWGLNTLIGMYFGFWYKDIDCGFKLMTKKSRDIILKKPLRMKEIISMEIMLRASAAHLKVTQVPIKHIKRKFGQSRGLPFKKIPKVINMTLKNFPLLKRDLLTFKTV